MQADQEGADERSSRRKRSSSHDRKRRSRSRSPRSKKDKDRGDKERSRSRSRGKRDRSRKDESDKRSRRKSRTPPRRERTRSRSRGRTTRIIEEEVSLLAKRAQEEEERKQREKEHTVFVSQIHPKVDERDLFEFFSLVGRVEDIRLIRDQRTQKSKGLCYVEFFEKASVAKAAALTGQLIGGYPMTVQIPEFKAEEPKPEEGGDSLRLFVGNLNSAVTDSDIRPIFEAFGPLKSLEVKTEPGGDSRGFGFVQYVRNDDARSALAALDGIDVAGRPMTVRVMDANPRDSGNVGELDEGGDGGMALTGLQKQALMARLSGQAPPQLAAPAVVLPPNVAMIQATNCIVIKNMFDPRTESDPEFHLDIKEDVEEEIAKNGGTVRHIFVDKESPQGLVYVMLVDVPQAKRVQQLFHGRWFASRQIVVDFVPDVSYVAKFPEARS